MGDGKKMNGKHIATLLLHIGAVSLQPNDPFTWSSGLKSPIYCDNRLTMSYPEIREQIIDEFIVGIKKNFPDVEVIAGTATAGIPHAAWIAQRLSLPMIYVRSKAKGHGKENLIEGKLEAGKKVLVIEDLISTGGSSIHAANSVRDAGGNVLGVYSIFTYELQEAKIAFQDANLKTFSLATYSQLLLEAIRLGKIREEDLPILKKWRENPKVWSSQI